jgi:hypothetical protein
MGIRVNVRLCLADIGALGTLRAQFARRTLLARTLAVDSQQTPAASLTRSPLGPKHVFMKRKYTLSLSSRQIDGDSFITQNNLLVIANKRVPYLCKNTTSDQRQ